jgi:hypothetical protein
MDPSFGSIHAGTTGGYRFFYVLLAADHMHILHSYRKQGQKALGYNISIKVQKEKKIRAA